MKNREPDDCGFATALRVIGGKWKTSLLWALHLRLHRFAELRDCLPGISEAWRAEARGLEACSS
jgi:DNA-binding HxlR family transcriptional regulator